MGEVVQLQVGQTGNRVGTAATRLICAEHGVTSSGQLQEISPVHSYGLHRFFHETSHTFQPRSLLLDLEPSALDQIRGSAEGRLYSPDQYVFDQVGSGNLFVRGYYGVGMELMGEVMEAVRKQAELCDRLHGFQLIHSTGGGTGSGLGACLMSKVREEYPDRMLCTYTLLPSTSVSDKVTEVYNTVLGIHPLVENVDLAMLFDNDAICNVLHRNCDVSSPTYGEINHQIAAVVTDVTAPMRFSGLLNTNYRKIAVNLLAYPRLHFFAVARAPLTLKSCTAPVSSVPNITNTLQSLYHPANSLLSLDQASAYRTISDVLLCRGGISTYDIDTASAQLRHTLRTTFLDWVPAPISSSICSIPPSNSPYSLTFLLNHGLISSLLQKFGERYTALFRRKAFFYHYASEGMDEMEFVEAESNVNDLVSEFGNGHFGCCYGTSDDEDFAEEADI